MGKLLGALFAIFPGRRKVDLQLSKFMHSEQRSI